MRETEASLKQTIINHLRTSYNPEVNGGDRGKKRGGRVVHKVNKRDPLQARKSSSVASWVIAESEFRKGFLTDVVRVPASATIVFLPSRHSVSLEICRCS